MNPVQTTRNANLQTPALRGFAFFNALKTRGRANFNALKIGSLEDPHAKEDGYEAQ